MARPAVQGIPMGVAEVATRLHVSRSRVHFLRGRGDFPEPKWTLACGPVWDSADIEAFSRKPRPPGRRLGQPQRIVSQRVAS